MILNQGNVPANDCPIAPRTAVPATFAYQPTDPATNLPIGTPNMPVDITAFGRQSFVLAFTPTAPMNAAEIELTFACANAPAVAPVVRELNTIVLSAAIAPTPDVVMIAVTPDKVGAPGLMQLPNRANAFAVAAVNAGAAGSLLVSADTGGIPLPATFLLCRTDPITAQCIEPPASALTWTSAAGSTATFSVFVGATGPIPFDIGRNRAYVRMSEAIAGSGGAPMPGAGRGSTCVAITTQ